MKQFFKKHRQLCLGVSTVLVVLLLLGLNILFPFLMQDTGAYPDITPEGLYTLTDKMKETCAGLSGEVTITFCDEPDRLLGYHDLRYVYIMAQQLANEYDHIRVETVNLLENPTAVNRFKTTSATKIEAKDVIVSCGERYRILRSNAFWTIGENTSTESEDFEYYSFNGEYKLATALLSVTFITEPVVCFTYGNGETIYVDEKDTEHADLLHLTAPNGEGKVFYDLVREAGLKVDYVNLEEEELHEDCVLVVINNPLSDYTYQNPASITETNALTRLHDFMAREETGSLMLFKDPMVSLPNLEDFAEDWGVRFRNDAYIRGTVNDTLQDVANEGRPLQKLIANLNPDENATPYSVFGELLKIGTTPRMIVEDSGYVEQSWISNEAGSSGLVNVHGYYFDFMYSADGSVPVNMEGNQTGDPGAYALAGLGMRMRHDTVEDTTKFSYCFGAASTNLTSNTYLEDAAFSNYDVLFSTVRFISRVDEYASMELGGTSGNSPNPGGKPLVSVVIPATGYEKYDKESAESEFYPILKQKTSIVWVVVLITIPTLAAGTTGVVLLVKRKNR